MIDYKELMRKYMIGVAIAEGTLFESWAENLTEEEHCELMRMGDEAYTESQRQLEKASEPHEPERAPTALEDDQRAEGVGEDQF